MRSFRCGSAIVHDIFDELAQPDLDEEPIMNLRGNRWQRDPDDFAVRIEVDDLKGLFRKELTVDQGTQALFFSGGAFAGTLGAGTYDLGNVFGHLGALENKGKAAAVVAEAGDVSIRFRVGPVYTSDPLGLEVSGEAVLRLAEPIAFYTNLMKGRAAYRVSELQETLSDELDEALSALLADRSATELSTKIELRSDLETRLANHLRTTFGRFGLELVQLRGIDWFHEKRDEILQSRETCYLLVSEADAKLEQRKRLFDVYSADELQEIAELTRKAQLYSDKAKVWREVRRATNDNKLDEVRSAEDLAREIQAIDRNRVLREDEWRDLTSQLSYGAEATEEQRRFVVAKARAEQRSALELAELAARKGVLAEEVELAALHGRKSVAEELARETERAAQRRREALEDQLAQRKIELDSAESQLETARLRGEVKRLEQQLWKEGVAARQDALETMKRRKLALSLEKHERELELKIREARAQAEVEASRADNEAKKLSIFAGMTEEQILATQAGASPEIARAFQTKFGASSEMHERLLREVKEASDKAMANVQNVTARALDNQRDVGVAAGSAPHVVMAPVAGAVTGPSSGAAGESADFVLCTQCKARVRAGQKFCQHCGEKMF